MRQQPIFVIAVRAKSVCADEQEDAFVAVLLASLCQGKSIPGGSGKLSILDDGWWLVGLRIGVRDNVQCAMLTHLTLQFASCALFSVVQRVVYAIPGKQWAPIAMLHNPHPPSHIPIRFVYCLANVFISVCGRLIIFVSFTVHTFANCRAKFNYDSLK